MHTDDTQEPDIIVTVLEAATVFEAEQSVYRYDIPEHGIHEGWAVAALLDQLKQMVLTWPECTVELKAEEHTTAVLSEILKAKGIRVHTPQQRTAAKLSPPPTPVHIERSIRQEEQIMPTLKTWPSWVKLLGSVLGIGMIVLGLLAVILRIYDSSTPPELVTQSMEETRFQDPAEIISSSVTTVPPEPSATASEEPEDPETQLLLFAGKQFKIPGKFLLKETTIDGQRIYGDEQAGLQLIFAKDQPQSINDADLLAGFTSIVAEDPTLSHELRMPADDVPASMKPYSNSELDQIQHDTAALEVIEHPEIPTDAGEQLLHTDQLVTAFVPAPLFSYVEQPGDGSQTLWVVYRTTDWVLSYGCQARTGLHTAELKICAEVFNTQQERQDYQSVPDVYAGQDMREPK